MTAAAAADQPPEEHTLTPDVLRARLRQTRRRAARTDRVVSTATDLTDQLASVNENPDHVIERLRAILQGG